MTAGDFTMEARLCENGIVGSGAESSFQCTGSAHSRGQHIRCTDPSHDSNQYLAPNLTLAPGLTIGPVIFGDLSGQRWTC